MPATLKQQQLQQQKRMLTQTGFHWVSWGELNIKIVWGSTWKVIETKWPNTSVWSDYSDLTRPKTLKGSFLEGNPASFIKSRLVKYYSVWHRSWPLFSLDVRVSSLAGFKLFATFRLRRSFRGGGGTVAILASWWYGSLALPEKNTVKTYGKWWRIRRWVGKKKS